MTVSIKLKSKYNSLLSIGDSIFAYREATDVTSYIGVLTDLVGTKLTIENASSQPAADDFIYFIKNELAAVGGIKGSVSHVHMSNNSKDHAELFAVNFGYTESSK